MGSFLPLPSLWMPSLRSCLLTCSTVYIWEGMTGNAQSFLPYYISNYFWERVTRIAPSKPVFGGMLGRINEHRAGRAFSFNHSLLYDAYPSLFGKERLGSFLL